MNGCYPFGIALTSGEQQPTLAMQAMPTNTYQTARGIAMKAIPN
jgi:hypothetical protein